MTSRVSLHFAIVFTCEIWASYLVFLSFNFIMCKMGIIHITVLF